VRETCPSVRPSQELCLVGRLYVTIVLSVARANVVSQSVSVDDRRTHYMYVIVHVDQCRLEYKNVIIHSPLNIQIDLRFRSIQQINHT